MSHRSALLDEQLRPRAHEMVVADPSQQPDPIEELQNLDRALAPQTTGVAKRCRSHGAVAAREFAHRRRQFHDRLAVQVKVLDHLEHGAALCLAESEKLVIPEVVTANFVYSRLRMPEYSAEDRKEIAARVEQLIGQSRDVYVFFKHEETPAGALYAEELLKQFPEHAAALA